MSSSCQDHSAPTDSDPTDSAPMDPVPTDWFGLSAPKFGTLIRNRIFVGGISSQTTEQELTDLFSAFGNVKASKIIFDRAGVSKGYGFVTFETEAESEALCNSIMRKELDPIMLRERKLNVAPAIKKQPGFRTDFPFPVDQQTANMTSYGGGYYQGYPAQFTFPHQPLLPPQTQYQEQYYDQLSASTVMSQQPQYTITTAASQSSMPVCFIQNPLSGFQQVPCFVPPMFPPYSFPSSTFCNSAQGQPTYFEMATQTTNNSQLGYDFSNFVNLIQDDISESGSGISGMEGFK